MTLDIFDTPFGTLDFIIYGVLRSLGIEPLRMSTWGDLSADNIALANAAKFLDHFGDRKIAAIKAVREVSGLDLRSAKEAVEQIDETYGDVKDIARMALDSLLAGRTADATMLLGLIAR